MTYHVISFFRNYYETPKHIVKDDSDSPIIMVQWKIVVRNGPFSSWLGQVKVETNSKSPWKDGIPKEKWSSNHTCSTESSAGFMIFRGNSSAFPLSPAMSKEFTQACWKAGKHLHDWWQRSWNLANYNCLHEWIMPFSLLALKSCVEFKNTQRWWTTFECIIF